MPTLDSPSIKALISIGSFTFWNLAYVLIIKRSFQDKTFGMPITAVCFNISWEFLFSFCYPVPVLLKQAALVWFVGDVLIFFTCLKYGRNDFAHPVVRKWFYPGVAAMLGMAALLLSSFITGYQDHYGKATGCLNGLIEAVLLNAMILRRNSVKGQSCYIALFMLIGNIFGYFMSLQPNPTPPQVPDLFIHALFANMLLLHALYLGLVYRQCRLDGVKPWRRF